MKTILIAILAGITSLSVARATEFHVAVNGNDANSGSKTAPLRTIQHAADLAQAGDVITVHEGVYRERVSPPRGGESDTWRIVYQAAPGEKVEIKGSELVKNWVKVGGDTWKVEIPNTFFGAFNPYGDLIRGDWFNPLGRNHHTGAVYLNGDWLTESATLDEVMKPIGITPLWFGQVNDKATTIWAQFKDINPNQELVEINVRQTVFYPRNEGVNYITVRGFNLEDAATPWAPPTAEQIGLIGTHWSRGWIIENNNVSYSICSGIALGKYGDEWDNTSANTAEGYVKTIERALVHGWSKQNIGHHVVRNNTISHCEQAGIVGSLGAAFSVVTGNTIHDIHVRELFSGAEMAGIKFHGAIDVQISRNHIYRTWRGIWLDWMAQGTRVSANLFHDNREDLFVEVDHGPFIVDNNIFLSPRALCDGSQGGAYVHNLFAGVVDMLPFGKRQTPYLKPHSTEVAGYHDNPNGDDRYYNNVFARGADLSIYDHAPLALSMDGNVYLKGAKPSRFEKSPLVKPDFDPAIQLVALADGIYLEMKWDAAWNTEPTRKLVTTYLFGRAIIPNLPYEQPDGMPIMFDTDYLGGSIISDFPLGRPNEKPITNGTDYEGPKYGSSPTPGPFGRPGSGDIKLKVW